MSKIYSRHKFLQGVCLAHPVRTPMPTLKKAKPKDYIIIPPTDYDKLFLFHCVVR